MMIKPPLTMTQKMLVLQALKITDTRTNKGSSQALKLKLRGFTSLILIKHPCAYTIIRVLKNANETH